mmetsp:Transcript_12719/g.35776  ORF Transcript_12719/g.35776 Transcript_12719/m.35776 type:complete len:214 (-) Transcript_12719:934-1575(-)
MTSQLPDLYEAFERLKLPKSFRNTSSSRCGIPWTSSTARISFSSSSWLSNGRFHISGYKARTLSALLRQYSFFDRTSYACQIRCASAVGIVRTMLGTSLPNHTGMMRPCCSMCFWRSDSAWIPSSPLATCREGSASTSWVLSSPSSSRAISSCLLAQYSCSVHMRWWYRSVSSSFVCSTSVIKALPYTAIILDSSTFLRSCSSWGTLNASSHT